MDIRSFFGKKPPAKKKTGGDAAASSKPATKKRKADDDDDDGGVVEISAKDFFAKSTNPKTKATAKATVTVKAKPVAEKKEAPAPPKNSSKTTKRKKIVDDSDETDEEFLVNDKNKSKNKHFDDSDETDEEFMANDKSKNKTKSKHFDDSDATDEEFLAKDKKKTKRKSFDDSDATDEEFMAKNNSDDDDDDYDDFEPDPPKPKATKTPKPKSPRTPSPAAKRVRKSPVKKPPAKKSPASTKKQPQPELELCDPGPDMERDSFDADALRVPECMTGPPTFVFTGVMDGLARDDAIDLVKTLGGRVTTAVSGKTNYLVVGPILEDGRDYKEGSKYKKATSYAGNKVRIVMGEKQLYGLCHFYHDRAMEKQGIDPAAVAETKPKAPVANPYAKGPAVANPYAKGPAVANPYAKKPAAAGAVSNPYAKKGTVNPYAKKGPANPYAKAPSSSATAAPSSSNAATGNGTNTLWVDRYKPTSTREILGNQTNVKKLQDWLRNWERTFNNPKNANKTFNNPRGPLKAALLSGPPGIGKTTTATLVAKEDGRDVLEYNASDTRSKKALEFFGDMTGSQGLAFRGGTTKKKPSAKKRCIIMDEVDGMGSGDRSGMSELIQMIKKSKTPIICICNDRQSQKMKSLLPYCMDLRYSRPTKNALANRAIRIAEGEGLSVERNAAEAIAESCGNDVRQVLNLLQMWAQKKNADGDNALTYKKLKDRGKSIQKDEMLRVSLFDAAKLIVEGPRNLQQASDKDKVSSFMKRTDAFFVDYSFTGLIVQQNYPKVTLSQYQKLKGDEEAEIALLERFHKAADAMSDYDMVESQIRGGDLNWSLLPTSAAMVVKTGYHAGGEDGGFLAGFPEFTAWMGKNSSMSKNYRLLNELSHHMNYKVSANAEELRRSYVPVLRDRILKLLKNADAESNQEAIGLMDDYGLSRDDIVDKLDVLVLGKKDFSFDDLDSKSKAAFTRQYNAGVHKSQALVREQGGGGKNDTKRKKRAAFVDKDEEGVEDLSEDESEDEVDEEKELAKLQAQFQKKGRRKAAPKKKK